MQNDFSQKDFTIKTFVKRNAKCSKRQKEKYEELSPKYCISLNEKQLDFSQVFNSNETRETIIEIGFGSGEATYKIALANPDTNYLGIEVFQTGVAKLLSKIDANKIENIRIIEHDAVEVLQKMISPNSVAGFHIFFPDPWQKKRHHKRRLMQADKISMMTEKLKDGGYIYFVTDWAEYAETALFELNKVTSLKNKYGSDFSPKQTWRPQTSFEKKALLAGREIFELVFEKETLRK